MAKGGCDFKGSVLFHCYGQLTEVIIPEGTTEIADGAFACNNYVEKIVIPSTVTKIGERAFGWCESLVSVDIPDSVTYIGDRAFVDCGYIKEIKLGKNIEYIGKAAFNRCSNLKKITLPPKLKRVENYAFYNCIRLKEVVLGEQTESIGASAFENTALSIINLNDNLKEIGDFAFKNSDAHIIEIPESVEKIGKNIIDGCEYFLMFECYATQKPEGWDNEWYTVNGKKPFTVWDFANTNGVVGKYNKSQLYIEGSVLKNCDGAATEVYVPDGVTTIDDRAFRECKKLELLSLPNTLDRICDDVFDRDFAIRKLEYRGTVQEWCKIGFYDCYANPMRCAGDIFIDGKNLENLVIPEGVTEIKRYAFADSYVKEIVLPKGLERIGSHAFYNALITKITLPESLEEIEDYAFNSCSNLKEVVFPDNLKYIGDYAFDFCYNLLEVTLSRNTEVEENAFNEFPNGFDKLVIKYKN